MSRCLVTVFAGASLLAAEPAKPPTAKSAVAYEVTAPSTNISIQRYEWRDAKRNRQVPVKMYVPEGKGPFPVVLFSHGLGGSKENYEYLGRHWSGCGYVSVHLQHHGSDDTIWKDAPPAQRMAAMQKSAATPQNSINRPLDVRFVIDQLEKVAAEDGPLKGKLDLTRIGMAGHSFGGYTTLAVAGQVFLNVANRESALADPRVKAAIQMSAPMPKNKERLEQSFSKIKIPVFHMTGTKDDSPIGDTRPEERRLAFDAMKGETCLVIFEDGDHMIFSGRERKAAGGDKDELFHKQISRSTTAFWDAYLKGDAAAKKWLLEGGFSKELGKNGRFEAKSSAVVKKESAATKE